MEEDIYRQPGAYWLYQDENLGEFDPNDDPLDKLVKTLFGFIVMIAIGLALCSLLPSCKSTRVDEEVKTVASSKTEDTTVGISSTTLGLTESQLEKIYEDIDNWYNMHIEKTIWSTPDSAGNQYKISTETLDGSGGSRKTRQDNTSSSRAVDLADSTSLSKESKTKSKVKTETKTETKTEEAGATAVKSVVRTVCWVVVVAVIAICVWGVWKWRKKTLSISPSPPTPEGGEGRPSG